MKGQREFESESAGIGKGHRFVKGSLWLIFAAGCLLRLIHVSEPLGYRLVSEWREADYTQIARNFFRNGPNIFYPRIDWCADGPGYVEMELPLIPWLASLIYYLSGYQEQVIRVISVLCSCAGLAAFLLIARRFIGGVFLLLAVSAFAFNPILVKLGNAMQPENLMLLFGLLGIDQITRWSNNGRTKNLLLAAGLVGAATLAKAPAIHLGAVLAFTVIRRHGLIGGLSKWYVWLAAMIAILPVMGWYAWANHLWKSYGNSLGVSNESHWIHLGLLSSINWILGNLRIETLLVFTPLGLMLAFGMMASSWRKWDVVIAWYLSCVLFYVAAAGTSGDDWASYYHCVSVAPACLIIAAGTQTLAGMRKNAGSKTSWQYLVSGTAVSTIGLLLFLSAVMIYRRENRTDLRASWSCAKEFTTQVARSERIIVGGGPEFDEFGRPVAYNDPMMFAWMNVRGFSYPLASATPQMIDEFVKKGAAIWIARNEEIENPGLSAYVTSRWDKLNTCPEAGLALLRTKPGLD